MDLDAVLNGRDANRIIDGAAARENEQGLSVNGVEAKLNTVLTEMQNLKDQNAQLRQDFLALQLQCNAMFNLMMPIIQTNRVGSKIESRKLPGGTYIGEIGNNLRHGKGTFISSDGSVLSGRWSDDVLEEGILEDSTGSYNGSFFKGIKMKGRQTYNDGTWFEGTWLNNTERSKGTFCDGFVKYKGSYDCPPNSKKWTLHGKVVCTFVDETKGLTKFTGEWKYGEPVGIGTYHWIDTSHNEADTWEKPWVYSQTPPSSPNFLPPSLYPSSSSSSDSD
ncbi:MAG: hypothetical protein Q8K75_01415 [Chlamydiales bacterium]|nr:hypothetical protein [Chlamydiales bacterium]